MTYRQEPPFSVHIEPTEGCNLRCGFCGIRGIREKGPVGALSGPYKFMDIATARRLANGLVKARAEHGWNPRIEMAMHGEPTVNRALVGIVAIMRQAIGPGGYILLTTNGLPLAEDGGEKFGERLRALFTAGLSTIAIDDYRPHPLRPLFDALTGGTLFDKMHYPGDGPTANPHKRQRGKRLVLVEDISQAETGNHSNLSNHAGCAAPLDFARADERCALPFRELSVRWDGSVALCCNDWRGAYSVGDNLDDLEGLWQSERFVAARAKLYAGERDFGPCHGCNHRTYRNGLLPDKMGRLDHPAPDQTTGDAIARATAHGTLTPVVIRRWEQ